MLRIQLPASCKGATTYLTSPDPDVALGVVRDASFRRNAPRFRSGIAPAALAVAVLALTPVPAAAQDSIEGDRAALVALYDATSGGDWTHNSRWKSDRPLAQWRGVTTNSDGRVIGLYLGWNQLTRSSPV